MGKYDEIFKTDDGAAESLTPDEAIAACMILTALVSYPEEEVDAEIYEDFLWSADTFADYSEEEMSAMVDKVLMIADADGFGALFNAANAGLTEEKAAEAFAVSVLLAATEDGIDVEAMDFLSELQGALQLEEEEAQQIIVDVIAALRDEDEAMN